jgi:hypothetical protein
MPVKKTEKKSEKTEKTLPLVDKWDGTAESKARLHKGALAVFHAVARELGLGKSDYDAHSNEMGPAIGGYIYFNTDTLHMWIDGGYGFEAWGKSEPDPDGRVESYVVARKCKHRKDYVGDYESDVRLDWELLWDPRKLVEVLRLEGFVSDVVREERKAE